MEHTDFCLARHGKKRAIEDNAHAPPKSVRGSYSARVPRSSLAEVHREFVHHIVVKEAADPENEQDDRREEGQQEVEGRIAESQNNHIMSA